MKVWTKVTAVLPRVPEDWAVYAEAFDGHGVPGTVQTDRPPTMSGYAFEPSDDDLARLRAALLERGAKEVLVEYVEEEDWAEGWKQFFKPRRVGKRFIVAPTWELPEPSSDDLTIVLDPGQAFGTGDHPTTRLCLELLEGLGVGDAEVADIGCGSGILSIAAMLMGARSAVAIDIERAAVESARLNAERNGVSVEVLEGRGFEPIEGAFASPVKSGTDAGTNEPRQFDLVLSNIISAALIQLAPAVSNRVRQGGHWIVSGVIEANWDDVRNAAERQGFRLDQVMREDGWLAASFRR